MIAGAFGLANGWTIETFRRSFQNSRHYGEAEEGGLCHACAVRDAALIAVFRHLHPEARFYSRAQFRVYRDPQTHRWAIDCMPDAVNPTLVNGKILIGPAWLDDGMTLAVGHPGDSLPKLLLTIRLGRAQSPR